MVPDIRYLCILTLLTPFPFLCHLSLWAWALRSNVMTRVRNKPVVMKGTLVMLSRKSHLDKNVHAVTFTDFHKGMCMWMECPAVAQDISWCCTKSMKRTRTVTDCAIISKLSTYAPWFSDENCYRLFARGYLFLGQGYLHMVQPLEVGRTDGQRLSSTQSPCFAMLLSQ